MALPGQYSTSSAYVGSGTAPPRRRVLGGLLPLLLPAVPGIAGAEEAKPATASSRISRQRPGGGKYSFELPKGDWKEQAPTLDDVAYFKRKDGAFISVGPVPPGFVKARFNQAAGPGNGFKLEKFKEGEAGDDLEWTQLATIYVGASGGGPFPGGFLFNQGDPTSSHTWIRSLHDPQGDVVMNIAIPQEKFGAESGAIRATLDSFRLEA